MRIKAFTILEVTVAMLLSAICIVICFAVYGIISNYYLTFQQKNQKAATALALRHVLEKDCLRSKLLLKTATGMELRQDSAMLAYTFTAAQVLRTVSGLRTDTFNIETNLPAFSFEGRPIIELDTIDQVKFEVRLDKDQVSPILVHKFYSAADLFH